MLLIPFLASALMSAPEMSAPALRDNDFARKLRGGLGSGAIFADLFVTPEGKVEGCEVTYSQQSKTQSARFCTNVVGLSVSNPAVGPDGKPEYGVFQFGRIVAEAGSPPRFELPPDLEVNCPESTKRS
ncbi:MAG: hypothetical protein ACXWJC_01480 [Croceibacterium sp.]